VNFSEISSFFDVNELIYIIPHTKCVNNRTYKLRHTPRPGHRGGGGGRLHAPFAFRSVKVGFYLKAVFPSRNLGLIRISRSRFKQSKNCSLISRIYVLQSFGNFWVIFGDIWEKIVFLNGLVKFREIRNVDDLM